MVQSSYGVWLIGYDGKTEGTETNKIAFVVVVNATYGKFASCIFKMTREMQSCKRPSDSTCPLVNWNKVMFNSMQSFKTKINQPRLLSVLCTPWWSPMQYVERKVWIWSQCQPNTVYAALLVDKEAQKQCFSGVLTLGHPPPQKPTGESASPKYVNQEWSQHMGQHSGPYNEATDTPLQIDR